MVHTGHFLQSYIPAIVFGMLIHNFGVILLLKITKTPCRNFIPTGLSKRRWGRFPTGDYQKDGVYKKVPWSSSANHNDIGYNS